jgi:hypothetical protein
MEGKPCKGLHIFTNEAKRYEKSTSSAMNRVFTRSSQPPMQQFLTLYRQKLTGARWLDAKARRGENVAKDTDDYTARILLPLDRLWQGFGQKERDIAEALMKVCRASIKG